MTAQTQQILLAFLAICSPFVLSFLIVALMAPRYKALSERNGWTVQPHPEDHRDYLFKGQKDSVRWQMECYVYEHYRYRGVSRRYIPFTKVIVWSCDNMRLSNQTLLVHPRQDRLKRFVHPRLALGKHGNLVANRETEILESMLSHLPQKTFDSTELQRLFVAYTDLEVLPSNLIKGLQFELLTWPKERIAGPVILLNNNGTTIWWIPLGMRDEWLEKTVSLGISLARSLQHDLA